MHNTERRGVSPLAAAAAGLVAGVAGATAIAMKDEVIRAQAKKRVNEAKDTIKMKAEEIKAKTLHAKDRMPDNVSDVRDAIEDADTV
jgi:hypothetical protein